MTTLDEAALRRNHFFNNSTASRVSWRKALLLNRSVLLSAWGRYFPQHDFTTLRLQSPPNRAESYWNGESWKRAASTYHEDRRRGTKVRA
jgi:hypothetical protein